jgi:hypothetical protein
MTDDMLSKLATAICSKSCICKDEGIIPVFERCVRRKEAAIAMLAVLSSPTEGMVDAASRARAAVRYKMPQALTLAEYAAPEFMAEDRIGIREALQAMLSHVLNERGEG